MHHPLTPPTVVEEVAQLLDTTLRLEPPGARPRLRSRNRSRLRLGGYLLSYGYLTPGRLVQALALQRHLAAKGRPTLLGDLVVAQQEASPRVITTMLTVQLFDQLGASPRPARLGERLVYAGLLRPAQLALVLQLQTSLRSHGQHIPLGSLLIEQRLVSEQGVQRMLERSEGW